MISEQKMKQRLLQMVYVLYQRRLLFRFFWVHADKLKSIYSFRGLRIERVGAFVNCPAAKLWRHFGRNVHYPPFSGVSVPNNELNISITPDSTLY